MAGWHQTIIVGNVGRLDEGGLKYTGSGTAVLGFSVAVTERYTSNGERQEKTTWYRVTCWRQLAETMAQFIEVGKQVMIVGNVEADAYMNNAGEPAASLKLTARDVQLLGSRGDGESANRSGIGYGGDAPVGPDIPFAN